MKAQIYQAALIAAKTELFKLSTSYHAKAA